MTKPANLVPLIIDAAELSTRPGIYYLGPFARRVSFVSQQVRALNLVWALHEDERIRANDRVAVVGAGIAGVTAACALRAYGCTVHIFDRGSKPMWRQISASHRMVHPNINFWPRADELLPTTSQPFLEWYYEKCNNVIGILRKQWDEVVAEEPRQLKFHREHDVHNVWQQHGKVFLDVKPATRLSYKAAIVAAGFGDEKSEPDFTAVGYWNPDTLEADKASGQFTKFVISGCGDGGMIDALRVAYDLKHGGLAIDVAASLAGTEVAALLKEYDKPERVITNEYQALVDKINKKRVYKKARELLKGNLEGSGGFVILLDKVLASPFNSGAAPIHKLMVAYALDRGIIWYRQGEVHRVDENTISTPFTSSHDAKKTKVVVRHGARLGFGSLLTAEEVEKYRAKQEILAEYNFQAAYSEYPVPSPWPRFAPHTTGFRSHRRPLAESAIRQFGNVSRVKATVDGFEAFYMGDLSFKPKQLFNVSVEFKREEDAPTEEPLV